MGGGTSSPGSPPQIHRHPPMNDVLSIDKEIVDASGEPVTAIASL
jgi:hypothetical protein